MKKKNIVAIVAVAVGCIGVASLFAFQGPRPKVAVPTTAGPGIGGAHMPSASGTMDQAAGQVVHGDGFANVTAPTEETYKKAWQDEGIPAEERKQAKKKIKKKRQPKTQKFKTQD